MSRDTRPQLLGLAVAADEDTGFQPFFPRQPHQFLENPAAFIEERVGLVDDDGIARDSGCGLTRLGIDVVDRQLAEEVVQAAFSGLQEKLGGPVIGRKGDFPRMVSLTELFQDIFGVGTAPLINGLEIVTAEEDVAAWEEAADDGVFDFARVLHFIDGNEAEAVLPALAAVFVTEKFVGAGDEIRKVDGVVVSQDGIVLLHQGSAVVGQPGPEGFFGRCEIVEVRDDALFLGEFNEVLQGLRIVARCRRRGGEAVDDLPAVFVVVEQEVVVAVALTLRFFFDETVAEAVDGLDDDGQALFVGRGDDAVLQFFAGPVGKGQTEYLRAIGSSCLQDMCDPAGQDAGLARAGWRVEQDWLREVADDLLLLVI